MQRRDRDKQLRKQRKVTTMEWPNSLVVATAKHSVLYRVISAVTAFLLFALGLPLCRSELFKSSQESLDWLKETSTFGAESRIECAAGCLIKTEHHECTAFILDESTKTCICGRKSFTTLATEETNTTVYVSTACQIQIPGIKTLENDY